MSQKINGFPEKILLATDGMENTTSAARAAVDLAGKGGAELHVVHVWHTVPSPHASGFIRSGLKEVGREVLERQVRWIEDEGGTVSEASLMEGHAVEGIIARAEEIGAGLVVAGSRGMRRIGRMALGSVATGLAHRSHCPVLVVPAQSEWPPARVMVGYGSFEDAERAGLLGASVGQALGVGTELVGVVSGGDADEAETGLRDMERTLAARADGIEEAVGQRPLARPLAGKVPEVIFRVQAEEERPALLAVGSKVLGKAGRIMAGEVLDKVLDGTRGPILITPEPHPASKASEASTRRRAEAEAREGPAVLVATDGSEVSRRAGAYAVRMAGGLGTKLFVLYVVDEDLTFRSGIHYGEFVGMLSEDGREATGKIRALAEEAGVECEELVVLGSPKRTIIAAAEEVGADPIVLGAEGMSGLEHTLIGSVSEEVLRHANRTVLVVGGHPEGGSPEGERSEDRS